MKKLLAISWCFPPTIFPRSIQVSRLLAALASYNWQSEVVCVDPSSLRTGQILDETLNRSAGGMVKKHLVPSIEDWILVRGLIRLFPVLGILPDPKWVWKNAAFQECEKLAFSNEFASLISFGQPWTDHQIGLKVKEQTHLPWIAHFSDPWADSPYVNGPHWAIQKRLEMETTVIKNADAVIFVSEQTANLVMRKYPEDWRSKVHVIPHGFEPYLEKEKQQKKPDSPLELVYTGGFYGHRSPEPLLRAAAEVGKNDAYRNSFRIRFIGNIPATYQKIAQKLGLNNCNFEGAATHEVSQKACQNADVLVVIDAPSNSESVFLPSKLVDYLAFSKPILGITPAIGASADLLQRLGFSPIDPTDIHGIAGQIRSLVDAKKEQKLAVSSDYTGVASQYHIKNAAVKLNQILANITSS
jgi:hypothetical protein